MGHLHREQQQTTIYDINGENTYPLSTSKIIRTSARHYGHTLKSLMTISREFFQNDEHKLPICLTTSYTGPCVFFPLWSPRTTSNIWINTNAVTNINPEKGGVRITLNFNREVLLPVQYASFCSLYSRSALFSNYITSHKYL